MKTNSLLYLSTEYISDKRFPSYCCPLFQVGKWKCHQWVPSYFIKHYSFLQRFASGWTKLGQTLHLIMTTANMQMLMGTASRYPVTDACFMTSLQNLFRSYIMAKFHCCTTSEIWNLGLPWMNLFWFQQSKNSATSFFSN